MRRISLGLLVVLFSTCAFIAQDTHSDRDVEKVKAERRTKLIEARFLDAGQLKLPENSTVISTRLAAAIWKDAPERATRLFKNAVSILISPQAAAESNKNPKHQYYELLTSQSLRPSIVNYFAS